MEAFFTFLGVLVALSAIVYGVRVGADKLKKSRGEKKKGSPKGPHLK